MTIVLKSRRLNLLEPSGPVQACNGIVLPFTLVLVHLYLQEETLRCDVLVVLFMVMVLSDLQERTLRAAAVCLLVS
jgi:hypothetical protein